MMPIYSKLNLEQYIAKVDRQKEVLQLSTFINDSCKKQLTECYEQQINIAKEELQRININDINVDYELISRVDKLVL